jgi:uncharacterized protein YjbI with pentapeptide repeats
MSKSYFAEEVFESLDAAELGEEYEQCRFINCDLSEVDISNIIFVDCGFENCNLSSAKVAGTAFRNVNFDGCKILGVSFDAASDFLFEVGFSESILDSSSFYECRLRSVKFIKCRLRNVDLAGADLQSAEFDECDLADAKFENTDLRNADLRTSFNYVFDPEHNRLKNARISSAGIAGLLQKYEIKIDQ